MIVFFGLRAILFVAGAILVGSGIGNAEPALIFLGIACFIIFLLI